MDDESTELPIYDAHGLDDLALTISYELGRVGRSDWRDLTGPNITRRDAVKKLVSKRIAARLRAGYRIEKAPATDAAPTTSAI